MLILVSILCEYLVVFLGWISDIVYHLTTLFVDGEPGVKLLLIFQGQGNAYAFMEHVV